MRASRRVGAVRRVGDEHLRPLLAARRGGRRVIISMPVSSPCAPAAGCSDTASMPVISASIARELVHELQRALRAAASGRRSGWRPAEAAAGAAMSSLIFGLYFIVHEPSG